MDTPLTCLDCGTDEGGVEYRVLPDRSDFKAFPRCESCFEKRLDKAEENLRKYPVTSPSDFDPSYAGERWDEEY